MSGIIPDTRHERDLLRVVACGSVDDGKSTLIGRLIADTGSVSDDEMQSLVRLSARYGTTGDEIDYALLLDGLESEREQGITIDVAYRYFGTRNRAFIVIDTPGHEQYTRNMVTGASHADLALLLVSAVTGPTAQTMRHCRVIALMGIRHVLVVVNKMDLVGFAEARFADIRSSFQSFVEQIGSIKVEAIPISARYGDNVSQPSPRIAWYKGPTVLSSIETTQVQSPEPEAPLRFLVQSVQRGSDQVRRYAGFVAGGHLVRGDDVLIARTGQVSRITRIATFDGDLERAECGRAVTAELADHSDLARGDTIASCEHPPIVADQFSAYLVWLDEAPLLPGRTYWIRAGTLTTAATVTRLKHKIDIDTGEEVAVPTLKLNDIGSCNLATSTAVAFDAYAENRMTGAFVLIDRKTAATVAAGMINFALFRASNVKEQSFGVDKAKRAHIKAQRPCVLWFTGLPGAGKSTVMNLVEERLYRRGLHTYTLDGDNLRLGINRDLGFTDADRVENIRRAGEVARLMMDAGLIVLCAFISPFRADREFVRGRIGAGEFIEVFVDAPLELCIQRDPKGLYAKARAGLVRNVTGIDSPYETPERPDVYLDAGRQSAEFLADLVVLKLEEYLRLGDSG